MSQTFDGHGDPGRSSEQSESEENEEEENEYELFRRETIAGNMARFQAVRIAAEDLCVYSETLNFTFENLWLFRFCTCPHLFGRPCIVYVFFSKSVP